MPLSSQSKHNTMATLNVFQQRGRPATRGKHRIVRQDLQKWRRTAGWVLTTPLQAVPHAASDRERPCLVARVPWG